MANPTRMQFRVARDIAVWRRNVAARRYANPRRILREFGPVSSIYRVVLPNDSVGRLVIAHRLIANVSLTGISSSRNRGAQGLLSQFCRSSECRDDERSLRSKDDLRSRLNKGRIIFLSAPLLSRLSVILDFRRSTQTPRARRVEISLCDGDYPNLALSQSPIVVPAN